VSVVRPVPESPLVGRDREAAYLRGLLSDTAAGSGGCAVVTGPAGIGKTRLLAEAERQARLLGLAVGSGRATELDRAAPLATLMSALLNVEPQPVDLSALKDHQGDRLWYVERVGDVLEEYVSRRPLLIVVDDLHWIDELSALALRILVPRLASSPLRWLLARRPAAPHRSPDHAVDWLLDEGARHIELAGLDEDSVQSLCANVLGARVDATVLALAARGRGNPFLLEQYLGALRATGQILVSDGVASVIGDDLPSSFLSAVDQRLRGLSTGARRLLQAGSIFGRPFTVHEAARLLDLRLAELIPAAEEAVSVGVLVEQGSALVFLHDLMRQAIYNHMSGPVRAAMHREVADLLRAAGRPAAEIAEHLMLVGSVGDRAAAAVLRGAAAEVAGRAPGAAADMALRALAMMDAQDEERPRVSAETVGLLASSGRLVEARELGEAVLSGGADALTEATLLLGLAEALKHAGQNRTAVEYAQRALARPSLPPAVRASLSAIEAHALLYLDDMPGADRAGAEADRLGLETGEHAAAAFGSTARSVVARADGRLGDALAHAEHAVTVADRAGGAALHRHPRIWLGGALAALDRLDDAERAYTAGRQEAERLGTAWSQPLWHFYNASLSSARGRLDEAVAEAEAGVQIAEQLTALQLCVPLLGLLTRLAVARDQPALAREHLQRMQRLLAQGITAAPEDVTWSIATFHFADQQPAAAMSALAETFASLPDRLLLLSNDPGAAPELVRIALEARAPVMARAVAAAAARIAGRNPAVVSLAAAAAQAEGLTRRDRAALNRAVELFRDSPRPLARVSAMEDAAVAEQEAGNRSRAIVLLQEAVDEAATCGAQRAVARMRKRLRGLGVRVSTPVISGPGQEVALPGLTATELAIANLVAQGLTNKQIAEKLNRSHHTVDSHLRSIFAKLNVNSRVGLAGVMLRTEQPPAD
jgi:ATP/maltotriose-dependent transcriptional regulator MalT